MNRKNWLDWCEQAVFVLLLVLMVDCTFFGAGRTLIIGGLGFRMMVLGLLMVCSVPVILRDLPKLITNKVLWLLVAFAFWLVIQAARGIVNGNSFGILLSDLKGFAYFVAILPVVCVLNSKKRIHTLMKAMMYTSVALAVISVISTCMYKWCHDVYTAIHDLDLESSILVLSCIVEGKVPRLFFKSTNYFLVGCAFSLYFYATGEKKGNWKYPIFTSLCLFALLMSYTRACYLAAAVAAMALLVIFLAFGSKEIRVKTWKWAGLAVVAFALVTGSLSLIMGVNYVKYGLERVSATFSLFHEAVAPEEKVMLMAPDQIGGTQIVSLSDTEWTYDDWSDVDWDNVDWGSIDWETIDSDQVDWDKVDWDAIDWESFEKVDWEKVWAEEEETAEYNNVEAMTALSDEVRAKTLGEMNGYISESPVLGHGLGKPITCRENGLAEYFYHDLVVKTGVIGLILYVLPVLWMAVAFIGKKTLEMEQKLLLGGWMAVLLGFMAFSYYNPYMNASLGILFYCCILGIFSNVRKLKF